jgi:hypothetical protein
MKTPPKEKREAFIRDIKKIDRDIRRVEREKQKQQKTTTKPK